MSYRIQRRSIFLVIEDNIHDKGKSSSKDDNNVSLNDDLRHIHMRWRNHKICIVADIIKIYGMVRVPEEDTDFQRFVWIFNSSEPIQQYNLLKFKVTILKTLA